MPRFLPLFLCLAGCVSGATPPREEIVEVPGTKIRLEMVAVAGGRFRDSRGREVDVRPFAISTREITWAQFDRFYEFSEEQKVDGVTRPSSGKNYLQLSGLPRDFQDAERPVTNLRYHAALAYCEWLSRRTGALFRLPTEIEWELACGRPEPPSDHAWFLSNSGGRTHAGGEKRPNALGLHDMLGNVWEYCLEPLRPPEFEPVLRGGAWNSPAAELDPGFRKSSPPEWSEADPNRPFSVWWFRAGHAQGFRVVRIPDPGAAEREACARRIEITGLTGVEHAVKVGTSASLFSRVTGEVRNGSDRPLDELILKVYYLDPAGRPHLEDVVSNTTRRATFNVCCPALASSAHAGDHARPLRPGERRKFVVDVPMTFDGDDAVQPEKFGAEVLHVRLSRD